MRYLSPIALPAILALSACSSGGSGYPMQAAMPIRHVVAVDLKNPGDYMEFSSDCFPLFRVPGVVNILTGPGLDTGEGEAIPCGAGVVFDMTNAEACLRMKDNPMYAALLAKWGPRSNGIRVVSFGPRCDVPAASGTR